MPRGVGDVEPFSLPRRFQQVHVDPAVVVRRGPRDPFQGRVLAPLRPDRSVLHPEPLALERGGDRLHLLHQVPRGVRAGEGVGQARPVHRVEVRKQRAMVAVDEGVAVEDRAREGDADPHVGRGPGDPGRLFDEPVRGERVVAVHGRADAGVRHPAESDRRFQPRVDGRSAGERCDPALEGVVRAAEGERPEPVAVVVGVHHRRQGEEILTAGRVRIRQIAPPPRLPRNLATAASVGFGGGGRVRPGAGPHRQDPAFLHLDHRIPECGLPPGGGQQPAEPVRPAGAHAARAPVSKPAAKRASAPRGCPAIARPATRFEAAENRGGHSPGG